MKQRELECLDKAIYLTPARKRHFKRIACYALFGAAIAAASPRAWADSRHPIIGGTPSFFKLDNMKDLQFNQLLGINYDEIIVGYFGDGMLVFNHGYVLVPNTHYSSEEFAGTPQPPPNNVIQQTQAIGINNNEVPLIVGFWQSANNQQFGFQDVQGVFTTVLDPNATSTTGNQNLLGVNDLNEAAGFWTDPVNEHGFVVNLPALTFTEIPPVATFGSSAVGTQASGINDNNIVCGFWVDTGGIDHGFFGPLGGPYTSFKVTVAGVVAKSTQALGCSKNFIVGSYIPGNAVTHQHGFIFDGTTFEDFSAPGSSHTPVDGVVGTIINGVNNGDIVGFFSDGTNVNGFVQFNAPVGPQ